MSRNLVAPRYEPAAAFHPPQPAPFDFGADTLSIEDLMDAPATRAIVLAHAPWAARMAESENFQAFRSTFTLRDAASFLPFDAANSVAEVDAALRALPRSEWPHSVQ